MIDMEDERDVANYIRVSTLVQDEKMQHAAADPVLKQVPQHRLLNFVDHGVSATKVPMAKRPQLQKMLALIRSGQIGTLVCYARDRLARDTYEYIEIVKLLKSRNVQVIFTASESLPFQGDLLVEGIYAIAASDEAKSIQRRVNDTVKAYPARLFGYQRMKGDDGFIRYEKDERYADAIARIFEEISSATGFEDFIQTFERNRKTLHRTEAQALRMLGLPFYAAHVERMGDYHPLLHVKPIISLDTFKAVQEQISKLAEWIGRNVDTTDEGIITPVCGICGHQMKLKSSIEKPPRYICSKGGHKVNSVDVSWYNELVVSQMLERTKRLNLEALRDTCSGFVRRHIRHLEIDRARMNRDLTEKTLALARQFAPGEKSKVFERAVKEIGSLQEEIVSLTETIRRIQAAESLHVTGVIDLVEHNIRTRMKDNGAVKSLAPMLFHKVVVFPDHIELFAYYSQFLNGGDPHEITA